LLGLPWIETAASGDGVRINRGRLWGEEAKIAEYNSYLKTRFNVEVATLLSVTGAGLPDTSTKITT
jgi:hypothetical protein